MKSSIYYGYDCVTRRYFYNSINLRHAAILAAIYTLVVSIAMGFLYCWRITVNMKKYPELQEVYYGVQIAYVAIVSIQLFTVALSLMLLAGIYRENSSLMVPWIIGIVMFLSLEALSLVYSNVLRDHINKRFDETFRSEVTTFIFKVMSYSLCIVAVMRFCNRIISGVSYRDPEVIKL